MPHAAGIVLLLVSSIIVFGMALVPSILVKRNKAKSHDSAEARITRIFGAANLDSSSSSSDSDGDEVIQYLSRSKSANAKQNKSKQRKPIPRLANVYWRSISETDLRSHPLYNALPETASITAVNSPADFRIFRQGSWQWNALHSGRLTTSKAASCLGFYEPHAGGILKLPKSLMSHSRAQHAWQQLRQLPLGQDDWASLIESDPSASPPPKAPSSSWIRHSESAPSSPFAFTHVAPRYSSARRRGYSTASEARLAWGSAQESTAILAAINYLYSTKANATVHEVGLMPFEAFDHCSDERYVAARALIAAEALPKIGASPDGLIVYDTIDGERCEVLEAKCLSPFMDDRQSGAIVLKSTGHSPSSVGGSDRNSTVISSPYSHKGVGAWHIPQLQMEIFCAGPTCTGALLVSLTALQGAVLHRVPRSDRYIASMLQWLAAFHSSNGKKAPERDFFWGSPGYREFLDHTLALAARAEVVAVLSQDDVQRSCSDVEMFLVGD